MQITWHGFSCFRITETLNGHEVSVVIDPFESQDGFKLPRNLSADVVVSSHGHPRHNNIEGVAGPNGAAPFVITGPGEFEVKDVFVTGVPCYHDMVEGAEKGTNTISYITIGDVHLVHLGDLKHKLEEKHMEDLHRVDVLFLPVGGHDVLDGKLAAEVVAQLDPRVIIPMHYKAGGNGGSLDGIEPFLKAMGAGKPEALPKLKLAAKDLPQDEQKIIVLDPQ